MAVFLALGPGWRVLGGLSGLALGPVWLVSSLGFGFGEPSQFQGLPVSAAEAFLVHGVTLFDSRNYRSKKRDLHS